MTKARTRFAPSPTGFLHIGGLRTALFAYLVSKKLGGDFILRIEDTDEKRKVEGAVEGLINIFKWSGIEFDEGPHKGGNYGPYIQTERKDIYTKYANELLEKGECYRCFCTPERLQSMREEQQANKQAPRYDRKCRNLSPEEIEQKMCSGEKFVIRQKMPLDGEVVVHDELRGDIKFDAKDLDDHVLIKNTGIPTYQFANVIDDHLMKITHVTRAEEWIPSFPKNVLLYKAFGFELPKFIHFPVILNKGGGKLSKRQGDVMVEDYKENGYLQEALINFCGLLGWHPKDDNEILSLEEIIEKFKIKDLGTSPAIFDIDKLDYFNGYYIRQKPIKELVELAKPYLKNNLNSTKDKRKHTDEFITSVVKLEQERMKKISEIEELSHFLFTDQLDVDIEQVPWKKMTKEEAKENLITINELLEKIPEDKWTNNSINDCLITYIKSKELKIGNFLWPMRFSLSGKKASPGPFEIAETLGKEETLEKINKSINAL